LKTEFIILFFISLGSIYSQETFRIAIDPGHGGIAKGKAFGDKYDPISKKYLETYKEGTRSGDYRESEIVIPIAKELKKILDSTKTSNSQLPALLKSFSNDEYQPIQFETIITREDTVDFNQNFESDPNEKYRLYDDINPETGKKRLGRISRINQFKPHLIVSIHLNPASKKEPGGMACVLTPNYIVFDTLRKISNNELSQEVFNNSVYSHWLVSTHGWTPLQNAIGDAWIYFHGYWSNKRGNKTDEDRFEGIRQNMITWNYADTGFWDKEINRDIPGPYARTHDLFREEGLFWDREKSTFEQFRRGSTWNSLDGDNHTACKELLGFARLGQKIISKKSEYIKMKKPYLSAYSLPTFTNAIVAYLEIGYINRKSDRDRLIQNRNNTASSLAIGIYSLFKGVNIKSKLEYTYPTGKPLEWGKYNLPNGKTYFEEVSSQ
jgi:N-acetylmuramoyl-L-alanine amidase